MAQATITIPDDKVDEVMASIGYKDDIDGEPNPVSKLDYFNAYVIRHLKMKHREWVGSLAALAAKDDLNGLA